MIVVYVGELVPPGDVSYLYDTDNPAAKPVPTHPPPSQPPVAQGTAIDIHCECTDMHVWMGQPEVRTQIFPGQISHTLKCSGQQLHML